MTDGNERTTHEFRITTAMVLAAGLGTRMRPLTDTQPKPLIRVADKALIDYPLDLFERAGVERAIVNVHYLADMVESHVGARARPEIIISDERDQLMETGGGLKKAQPHFHGEAVFCTNTDAILLEGPGLDPCARLQLHWAPDDMDALLLLVPIAMTSGYDGAGDFERSDSGQISFRARDTAPYVFTGLQIIKPSLLCDTPDAPFSTKILWDKALHAGRLYGVTHDGFWMHVGDPAGLALAEKRFLDIAKSPAS